MGYLKQNMQEDMLLDVDSLSLVRLPQKKRSTKAMTGIQLSDLSPEANLLHEQLAEEMKA